VDSLQTSGAESARILTELHDGFERGRLTPQEVTSVPLEEAIAGYQRLNDSTQSGVPAPKMALQYREW
jgi:hypothetical protein